MTGEEFDQIPGNRRMTGPENYLEALNLLRAADEMDDTDPAWQPIIAGTIARAQAHATLAHAAAVALAIDPTPEAVAEWDPLLLTEPDDVVGPPLADDATVCGDELNPGAGDGVTCIRYTGGDEHSDGFHDDGRGNRWAK